MKSRIITLFLTLCTLISLIILLINFGIISFVILFLSSLLIIQSVFTLFWMLYAWENPHDADRHRSPKDFEEPSLSFSLLIPARHEEKVIGDTILAINKINYPKNLIECLILIRSDDLETLNKANKIINENLIENIRVVSFDTSPVNKPHALNVGLKNLKNEVVGIFDAEDEPHKNILNIINTIYQRGEADVVQSGVQLMNHKTRWYSFHSVLEYFFWFKSGLLFFSRIGKTTPLGGNTVFIKTPKLREVGGWDENILTEDADLGIRLSMVGAKTKVIYDELHVTREESPQKIPQMIKQRTRWNLGFLQVIMKGDWRKLPTLRQRIFAFYILVSPFPQSLFIILSPISIFIALSNKLPMLLTLFSLVPLYLFVLQIVIQIVATYEFSKIYRLKYSFFTPFKTFVTFFPYQIFLLISALRALFRLFTGQFGWEKTHHSNLHRKNLNFET